MTVTVSFLSGERKGIKAALRSNVKLVKRVKRPFQFSVMMVKVLNYCWLSVTQKGIKSTNRCDVLVLGVTTKTLSIDIRDREGTLLMT